MFCNLPKEIKKIQEVRCFLGCEISLVLFSRDSDWAARVVSGAFERISELESVLSKFKQDSDISQLNQVQSGEARVSPHTFKVIEEAASFGSLTNGAFDITSEPLLRLWEGAEERDSLPSKEEIQRALSLVGFGCLELNMGKSVISFAQEGMRVDLGGIGKGYIIDEVVRFLKSCRIPSGLVDAGGDLSAFGENPERGKWIVGLRNPLEPGSLLGYFQIPCGSVVTSGNYMRYFTIQGKQYSHIIDPRTGQPVNEDLLSVTVLAPDTMTADALATSVSVLGVEEGVDLIESRPDTEALIITRQSEKLTILKSSGFPELWGHEN